MGLLKDIGNGFSTAFTKVKDIGNKAKNMVVSVGHGIEKGVSNAATSIGKFFTEGIPNAFNNTKNTISNAVDSVTNPIVDTFKDATGIKVQEEAQKANEEQTRTQLQLLEEQNKAQNQIARENIDWQKEAAYNNLALQQAQFDYQKRLNESQQIREDTAIQRQVADLAAAGLSPLMVSGGSSTSVLSAPNAPQLDTSGISTAQGSYLNLAQQYSALRQEALSNSQNRRTSITNSLSSNKQGAAFALANLVRNVTLDLNQRYLNLQNFRLNALHTLKQNQLIDEQIKSSKSQRNWNEAHGYRRESLADYLVAILNAYKAPDDIVNDIKTLIEENKEPIQNTVEKVQDVIESSKEIPKKVENKVNEVLETYTQLNNDFIDWQKLNLSS